MADEQGLEDGGTAYTEAQKQEAPFENSMWLVLLV